MALLLTETTQGETLQDQASMWTGTHAQASTVLLDLFLFVHFLHRFQFDFGINNAITSRIVIMARLAAIGCMTLQFDCKYSASICLALAAVSLSLSLLDSSDVFDSVSVLNSLDEASRTKTGTSVSLLF
jgi:hypothetical protein